MGRKSRAKHSGKPPAVSAYSNKKEVDRLAQKLINACMKPTTRKDEWENYLEIQFLVERIRQYQSSSKQPLGNRMEKMAAFEKWLNENGIELNNVSLENYGGEFGIGLKAKTSIKRAEKMMQIPYKLMLSAESAKDSYLNDFIESRKILSEMPNVALSLYLHCERYNPDSFYKPYIDTLPTEYNTTLYFTVKEMENLKGSSALTTAISQYKSIARQYGIFYSLMHSDNIMPEVAKIPLAARNEFTYDAYRWAVSTVSTRLNKITLTPREEIHSCHHDHGGACHDHHGTDNTTLALIPLWDMMNHSNGQISTDCNPEEKYCINYAMKDFEAGEQVTIFYGSRSNIGFLIYNGFVVENNPYDRVEIQLGVSPNDKLYQKRVNLLEKLQIKPSGSFHLYAMVENLPASPDLLAFLRVFHMSNEDLDSWCTKELFGKGGLKDIYMPTTDSPEYDTKIWKFLENRVELLLRVYKRSEEDDEKKMSDPEVSERYKLGIRLHNEAKRILKECQQFCHDFPIHPEKFVYPMSNHLMSQVQAEDVPPPSVNVLPIIKEGGVEGGGERDNNDVDVSVLNAATEKVTLNHAEDSDNPNPIQPIIENGGDNI